MKFAIFPHPIDKILDFYVPGRQNSQFLCTRSTKFTIFMCPIDEINVFLRPINKICKGFHGPPINLLWATGNKFLFYSLRNICVIARVIFFYIQSDSGKTFKVNSQLFSGSLNIAHTTNAKNITFTTC